MDDSAIGDLTPPSDGEGQRRDERDSLMVLAMLRRDDGATERVRVRNVSAGGLMAQTTASYPPGSAIGVEIDGIGEVRGTVAWAESGRIGIAFDHPIEKAAARVARPTAKAELFRHTVDVRRPAIRTR